MFACHASLCDFKILAPSKPIGLGLRLKVFLSGSKNWVFVGRGVEKAFEVGPKFASPFRILNFLNQFSTRVVILEFLQARK